MSNSLLKSPTSWFMRPQHHIQTIPIEESHACQHPRIEIFLPPEHEFSIRKYCPVTLNHLLPDLHHTKQECLEDAKSEFDAILQDKFKKHLEESHLEVSGTSSEGDSDASTGDTCLNMVENNKPEPKHRTMKILYPNKVNYPLENMKMLLPDVVLNNKRTPSPVLTKNFCTGCINRGMALKENVYKNANAFGKRKNVERHKINGKDERSELNVRFPCVKETADVSTKAVNSFFFDKNVFGFRFFSEEASEQKQNHFLIPKVWGLVFFQLHRIQVSAETFVSRNHSYTLLPPSPYMMELARLRREKLRIEEKMLLKRRQVLELERLRPPIEKW
ncbi:uncharacterized protein TNCT_109601 [Trichonephila clavata]|uniref:Uncharacterized protein n=1 Tax=Trichonephila clavata TaxID=2740835 RepID=A0A8X6K081_TRICU|nr:uncharacterized protein TNCT_109601 [Trichonephila clavata]